jgi:hypothetical protein
MVTVTAKGPLSKGLKVRRFFESIPCFGLINAFIFKIIETEIENIKRRRNSHKLAIFFRFQACISFIGVCLFFYVFLALIKAIYVSQITVETTCNISNYGISSYTASSGYTNSDVFLEEFLSRREILPCSNDGNLKYFRGICSSSDLKFLVIVMIFLAVFFLISMVMATFASMGYSFFSNLHEDSLDDGSDADCRIACLGFISKMGPRMLRYSTITSFLLLVTVVLSTETANLCKGDINYTSNCINFYDDCAYNQIKNCLYYYSSNCQATDGSLPHTTDPGFASNTEQCTDPDVFKRFSGRMDMRLVFSGDPDDANCKICWALHYDCLDADTDYAKMIQISGSTDSLIYDSTDGLLAIYTGLSGVVPYMGDIASTRRKALASSLYCKCKNTSSTCSDSAKTVNSSTCAYSIASPSTYSTAFTKSSLSSNAYKTFDSPYSDVDSYILVRNYEIFHSSSLSDPTLSGCGWAASTYTNYKFEENECTQSGSLVNRIGFLVSILMMLLTVLVIGIGGLIRKNFQQETWSYDPPANDENACFKIIRWTGPG